MKNKRMLSIGKFNLSPSLEHTPKARSSKNNFNLSMGLGKNVQLKVQKITVELQTTLIIKRFWVILIFFVWATEGLGQQKRQPKVLPSYTSESSLVPGVITLERDSLRFQVQGLLPNSTARLPRQTSLNLRLVGKKDSLDLGEIEVIQEGGFGVYKKKLAIAYLPWMEGASLRLELLDKKVGRPLESKVLAQGVRAPQLLVRIGQFLPGEKIPEVGWYKVPENIPPNRPETAIFHFLFAPGKWEWSSGLNNELEKKRLGDFLKKFPEVQSLQLTGLQSPEAAEGRSSQLGNLRAEVAGKKLIEFFPNLAGLSITYTSRWNDWFDFRVALSNYEGLSEARKEAYNQIILSEDAYLEKGARLRSLPDFTKVSSVLYPQLRSVKVELIARSYLGLTGQKAQDLREALRPQGKNRLSLEDWERAAAGSEDLEEKGFLYSKMIQWYPRSNLFSNLAVVRMRQAQEFPDIGSKEVLWEEAERLLDQANRIQVLPLTLANQGQLKVLQGEYWEGYKLLSDASVLAKGKNASLAGGIELLRGALDVRREDFKLSLLRFDVPISEAKDFFNKGIAFYVLGEYMAATTAFEASVIQSREFGYGYYGLALVASDLGQQESALFYLQKAIAYNPALKQKVLADPTFEKIREQVSAD